MAQSALPDANPDALTVRISADGVCYFLDDSAPCWQLGKELLAKHLAQHTHLHFEVDRAAKYEVVAATLKSLQGTGFKVGFVNDDAHAPPAAAQGKDPQVTMSVDAEGQRHHAVAGMPNPKAITCDAPKYCIDKHIDSASDAAL